jgi:PST family polysaccharide transporter
LVLLVCNYVQAAAGFAINFWLANRLGSDRFGILGYGLVVASFVTTLVAFASDRTLVRDLIHSDDADAVMTASMLQRLGTTVLVALGCALWLAVDPSIGEKLWPVVLCAIWGALMGLFPTAWYDRRYEMDLHAIILLVEKLLSGVFIAILLTRATASAATMAALGLVASRLLAFAFQWFQALASYRIHPVRLKANLAWLTRENTPILGAALANMLLTHGNQLVLGGMKGTAPLGHYVVAFQLIAIVQILQGQIVRLLGPRIAEVTHPKTPALTIRRELVRQVAGSQLVTLAIVGPLAVLAPWIIQICLPPDYAGAVMPLRILCLWCILYGPALVVNQFLLCLRLNGRFFVVTVATGVLALVLGAALIPRLGASGVALSLLLAHSLSIGMQVLMVWRKIEAIEEDQRAAPPPEARTHLLEATPC